MSTARDIRQARRERRQLADQRRYEPLQSDESDEAWLDAIAGHNDDTGPVDAAGTYLGEHDD